MAKTLLSLGPTSDLVVHCPWKVDILEADFPSLPVNRFVLTFQTLFKLHQKAREGSQISLFANPIERLQRIHSFRLIAQPDGLLVAVTYDFGWESYMRTLWGEAGPFLDLLCSHCAGYLPARNTELRIWRKWIQDRQVESAYFDSATALTVGDLAALSQSERLQRDEDDAKQGDRLLAGFASRDPVQIAKENRLRHPSEAMRQGIAVIVAMYQLTTVWTADVVNSALREDAITLILATRRFVEDEFITPGSLLPEEETRYATELAWFRQQIDPTAHKLRPNVYMPANVQRGVVTPFDQQGARITHGAAVFLAITDAELARGSLARWTPTSEADAAPAGGVFRNLAFTYCGLQRLGLPAAFFEHAPIPFREGAAARAGLVGDVRGAHPSCWQPLKRNWKPNPRATVSLDQVDVLIQLRTTSKSATGINDTGHPLRLMIEHLSSQPGLELLAVEGLEPADPDTDKNHLGVADGISQPTLGADPGRPWSDSVEPDTLLVGSEGGSFWQGGSFLVVRRMTVDLAKFDALLTTDSSPSLRDRDLLAAKIIGRMPDGKPLAPAGDLNNFVYDGDDAGALCPLGSHVRRANPRRGNPPRIMRRGMSFGHPLGHPGGGERGSFFMAYCADLAEQYERVLTWVNGGNSTGIGSYIADPLTVVPDGVAAQAYRFLHAGGVHRLSLPGAARPVISLSWSMYLFTPSLSAITALDRPVRRKDTEARAQLKRGRQLIKRMTATVSRTATEADWRALLDESAIRDTADAEDVWAAIRAKRAVMDTPAGYLVANYDLVMDVLRDDGSCFSNHGAGDRTRQTFGPLFLCMDPCGTDYTRLSHTANNALRSVTEPEAFARTREATDYAVKRAVAAGGPAILHLVTDLIEPVFGTLYKGWFGIPDGIEIEPGSQTWALPEKRKPRCPGDFWSPSRDAFNPFRSAETFRLAMAHGHAIVQGVENHIRAVGRNNLSAPLARAVAKDVAAYPTDHDLAVVLVGCVIGGVSTLAGTAARMLRDLVGSGEGERRQRRWLASSSQSYIDAEKILRPIVERSLTRTAVPELLWRTVVGDGVTLGGVKLQKDRTLILSMQSASLERISDNIHDTCIPFGIALDSEHPTAHGCSARCMAQGMLLGLVAGLLGAAMVNPVGAPFMADLRRLP